MMIGMLVAVWVLCGVLAYGLCYYSFQKKFGNPKTVKLMGEKWVRSCAWYLPHLLFLWGPVGLLTALICGWPLGLQYRYKS